MKINCVQIELTNNCNYRCARCPRTPELMTRNQGFMKMELFDKVIKESFKISNSVNLSFFGEPSIHPYFSEVLDYFKNRPNKFKVVINTNLSLFTKDLFQKIIDAKITQIRVSVDAATPKTYDIVRPSLFCFTMNGLKVKNNYLNAIDEKLRYWHSLADHSSTRHVYAVSSLNRHEVDAYVKKWKPFLEIADEILIKSILTYGGKITDPIISSNACNIWSQQCATIDWEGNLSPCNLDTNMNLKIGNVKESSIAEVWNSPAFDEMKIKSLSKKIYPCTTCIDSNNWSKNMTIRKHNKWNYKKFKEMYGIPRKS